MATDLLQIVRSTKYPPAAFAFVQRGLDATVRKLYGDPDETDDPHPRHVTGQQLCLGLRDFAIQQYGLMAGVVLKRWHITSCEDFGHIVFAMIDAGLMHKSSEDTIHDFVGVFDFAKAFGSELDLTRTNK